MSANRDEYVRHRLARASETLEEARVLADKALWHGVVNRLYYACFYAVSALLFTRNLASSKHSGVRALFNQHFVKSGMISIGSASLYSNLFENRQESDYEDFFEVDEAQALRWIEDTGRFVDEVAACIRAESQ